MNTRLTYTAVLLLTASILAFVPRSIGDYVRADPEYAPHEIEAAKESIALSLLGQLQLSVGDLMWLKSMEYLHVGMVQRMPTRAEEELGYLRRDSEGAAAGLGHTEGVNMTLDSQRDFRGWLGTIERNVKPYSTQGRHDDPVELIPWYQLAVKLNPSLERLYTLGAFYMADFAEEPGSAWEMLETGMEANPGSWEIKGALGRLMVEYSNRIEMLQYGHHHDHHHGDGPGNAGRQAHHHGGRARHSHGSHGHHHGGGSGHSHSNHGHKHGPAAGHRHSNHEHKHGPAAGHRHSNHAHKHGPHRHIETEGQALGYAVDLLRDAVDLAQEHRRQLASRRLVFDDFQNQVFVESFLYLSQAYVGLERYEEAVAVAQEGYDTATQSKNRSILRVQKRIAERALRGEEADEHDRRLLARRGSSDAAPEEAAPQVGHSEDAMEDRLPVSVILRIPMPESLPSANPPPYAPELLADIRAHPYEAISERTQRMGADVESLIRAADDLVHRRFIEMENSTIPVSGESRHFLTPIGLYVELGYFDFNFWVAMQEDASILLREGIELDLRNPASSAVESSTPGHFDVDFSFSELTKDRDDEDIGKQEEVEAPRDEIRETAETENDTTDRP